MRAKQFLKSCHFVHPYESSSKNKITFTFENPTRDYVDLGLVGTKLVDHTLMNQHALIARG